MFIYRNGLCLAEPYEIAVIPVCWSTTKRQVHMVRPDRCAIKVCVFACDLCNNEEAPPTGSEKRRNPEVQGQCYRFHAGRPQANGLPSLSLFPGWKCEGTETGLQGCCGDRRKGQPGPAPVRPPRASQAHASPTSTCPLGPALRSHVAPQGPWRTLPAETDSHLGKHRFS